MFTLNLKPLLALLCLLAFNSCEQSEEDFNFPSPRIKTMTIYNYDGTPHTYQFKYDAQGRIIQRTFAPGGVETYRYLSDTLVVTQTHRNGTLFHIDSLWLNDQGLAITHKNWDKGQSPLGNAYIYTYTNEYNSEGFLIRSTKEDMGYEIQDGNTVKQIHYYRSDDPWQDSIEEVNSTTIYQFTPNSVNTIGYENMGMSFWGKQNKNLVSETQYFTSNNPEPIIITNSYSYQWDAHKRVIKQNDGSGTPSTMYTYY